MSYTHTMHALASAYDTAITEKKWQDYWLTKNTYAWDANTPRAKSYVIDTPPHSRFGPTAYGACIQLHAGRFHRALSAHEGHERVLPDGLR